LVPIAAALAACAGTALVRAYAVRRSLLDIPNHRSSHTTPTPRGGGLAIVVIVLAAVAFNFVRSGSADGLTIALLGGGGLIALAGWLDDHRSVPAIWRALSHFSAAILAVYFIGVPDTLAIGSRTLHLGFTYDVLAVFGLVWLTNLFNFMDGIDGIAASEAVSVSAAGGAFMFLAGDRTIALATLVVCGASFGFLVWNWPPAKIFMGDVGSGFLGFVLGALAVASISAGTVSLGVWVVLLGAFLLDTTITLLRRLGKERFYEAHRRHAYQRAVQSGLSHRRVTASLLLINSLLTGIAAFAWWDPARVPFALVLASVTLAAIYWYVERRLPMWGRVRTHSQPGELT
jgi:Fuc2NAc and GlcNAc transferase